jgi:hydrogenase-4 component B
MSGVIHKAGLYALLRFTLLLGTPDRWMAWALLIFSTISALVGALYTISQRDLKRLLGYSSTENVGIIGIGFGVGYLGLVTQTPLLVALGFGGGLLHVVNHALFKCLLFYGAGAVSKQAHTVDLERLGGLIHKLPWTGIFFVIGGLASAGLPPFNGFVSEFLIYVGLLHGGALDLASRATLIGVAAALALTGGLSAFSIVRAIGIGFLGRARDPHVQVRGNWDWGSSPGPSGSSACCHPRPRVAASRSPIFYKTRWRCLRRSRRSPEDSSPRSCFSRSCARCSSRARTGVT